MKFICERDAIIANKKVRLGDNYKYLKKSLDKLQNQLSNGKPPELYPKVNKWVCPGKCVMPDFTRRSGMI